MSTKGDIESRPPRSLTEIASQISSSPDHSASLLELVASELQHVDGAAAAAEHGEDDAAATSRLGRFASSFLSPLPASPGSPGDKDGPHCRHLALCVLDHLTGASASPLDDDVLLAIIPYATGSPALLRSVDSDVVPRILARRFSERSKSDFIVSVVLETAVRPRLSNWSSSRLTATGRVAAYEETASRSAPVDVGATPPWAAEGSAMVPLFQWALNESDPALLERHWPSFTPFLLALLDDTHTSSRAHGLRAAETFIRSCPPRVLAERGIGTVLEEAVLPTLHFLPSHTPEAESARLLGPAYAALVLLARTKFTYDGNLAAKLSLLDKLLREGIFSAYSHASEYVRIVEVLAVNTRLIIDELGIYATKHLKDVIPMLSSIMVDPFLAQHSECLLTVALALRSTILNCWPRVLDHYGAEVLRSTIMCWLNIGDNPVKDQAAHEADLREALRNIATLVSKGLEGSNEEGPMASLRKTIGDKPELRALFH